MNRLFVLFMFIVFNKTTINANSGVYDDSLKYNTPISLKKNKENKVVLVEGIPLNEQIRSANTTYVIKSKIFLTGDLLMPPNCTLQFKGGMICGPYVISGQCTKILAEKKKLFETNVTLNGTWNIKEAYAIWYGAVGDGKSDDTKPLQNLLNMKTKCVLDNRSVYCLKSMLWERKRKQKSSCLTLYSNTTLEGNNSTFILGDNFLSKYNSSVLICEENVENIIIRNLTFDGNSEKNFFVAEENEIYRCYFICCNGGKNVKIEKCNFFNCPGRNAIMLSNKSVVEPEASPYASVNEEAIVRNCFFKTGGAYIKGSKFNTTQNDFSFIFSEFSDFKCYNNTFINLDLDCKDSIMETSYENRLTFLVGKMKNSKNHFFSGGIEIHGDRSNIYNNKIIGCKPAMYICAGKINEAKGRRYQEDIWVHNNQLIDCAGGIYLFSINGDHYNINIINNRMSLVTNGVGIGIVGKGNDTYNNFSILHNIIQGSSYLGAESLVGIKTPSGSFIKIMNNTIKNVNTGISMEKSTLENVIVKNNKIRAYNNGILQGDKMLPNNAKIENNSIEISSNKHLLKWAQEKTINYGKSFLLLPFVVVNINLLFFGSLWLWNLNLSQNV